MKLREPGRTLGNHHLLAIAAGALLAAAGVATGCGDDATATTGGGGEGGSAEQSTGTRQGSTTHSTGAHDATTTASTGGDGGNGGNGGSAPVLFDCTSPVGTIPDLKLTDLGDGYGQALLAKAAPDDPDTLYVLDRQGSIWIYKNGDRLATPFAVVPTQTPSEEGLLGIAFHPNFANNGRFFVHYSDTATGANTIQEYKRDPSDPNKAIAGAIGLKHTTAQANHNGGSVDFGPDGLMYLSMGDGGNQDDPECDAQLHMGGGAPQEPEDLLGKISRLDVDHGMVATGFPAANGNPMGLKAYHIGFRNPFRMSFDVCNGDLYIGDVGQDTWEEIDVIKQSEGAQNCGWPYREGLNDFNAPNTCPAKPANLHEPILNYKHMNGRNAVIGGFVYRASTIPSLRGTYFYGDNGSGEIWYHRGSDDSVLTSMNPGGGVLGGFGQDGRGNVYVATLNGHLFRIDAQ